jgi:hypothetical protein
MYKYVHDGASKPVNSLSTTISNFMRRLFDKTLLAVFVLLSRGLAALL